jgi:hypothetical protein
MLTEIHDSITRLRDMLDRAQALSTELNAQQRRTGIRRFVHFSDGGGTARWQ